LVVSPNGGWCLQTGIAIAGDGTKECDYSANGNSIKNNRLSIKVAQSAILNIQQKNGGLITP
jgi:hypothetical protein